MSRRLMLSLAAVAATMIPALNASSAVAADSASCQFTGSVHTSGVNLGPPINSPNSGTWSLTSLAAPCVYRDDNGSNNVFLTTITASGSFSNAACLTGTGTATGTATVTGLSDDGAPITATADLSISFEALGLGTLSIANALDHDADGTAGGNGSGVVSLIPTAANTTQCTDFVATGAFTSTIGDD